MSPSSTCISPRDLGLSRMIFRSSRICMLPQAMQVSLIYWATHQKSQIRGYGRETPGHALEKCRPTPRDYGYLDTPLLELPSHETIKTTTPLLIIHGIAFGCACGVSCGL